MPDVSRTRRLLVALALLSLAAVPACKPKETDVEDTEASVSSVRLTVGSQTITITSAGDVTGGPVTVTRPTGAPISAVFLNAAGSQDPAAHGGNFLHVTGGDNDFGPFPVPVVVN